MEFRKSKSCSLIFFVKIYKSYTCSPLSLLHYGKSEGWNLNLYLPTASNPIEIEIIQLWIGIDDSDYIIYSIPYIYTQIRIQFIIINFFHWSHNQTKTQITTSTIPKPNLSSHKSKFMYFSMFSLWPFLLQHTYLLFFFFTVYCTYIQNWCVQKKNHCLNSPCLFY